MLPQSRLSIAVLLALATAVGVASCRKHLPKPPDGPLTGNGGSGGSGGTGSGGAGGTMVDARDMAPIPDMAIPDMMEVAPPDIPPGCGLGGQPCCAGNLCKDPGGNEGCCENGTCTDHSTPCRLGDKDTCFHGACGGHCAPAVPPATEACCGVERNCSRSYSICTGVGRGICVNCGGNAEPCCANGLCKPGGTCANMVCVANASLIQPQ